MHKTHCCLQDSTKNSLVLLVSQMFVGILHFRCQVIGWKNHMPEQIGIFGWISNQMPSRVGDPQFNPVWLCLQDGPSQPLPSHTSNYGWKVDPAEPWHPVQVENAIRIQIAQRKCFSCLHWFYSKYFPRQQIYLEYFFSFRRDFSEKWKGNSTLTVDLDVFSKFVNSTCSSRLIHQHVVVLISKIYCVLPKIQQLTPEATPSTSASPFSGIWM